MRRALAAGALVAAAVLLLRPAPPRRMVQLPPGVVEIDSEIRVGPGTELRGGAGTVLRASPRFRGRALVVCTGRNIALRGFSIDANRAALEAPGGLPPYDRPFSRFTTNNGILAESVSGFSAADLRIRQVAGF